MKICIVGLGLIGGSFAKAVTNRTSHQCMGIDANADTCTKALGSGAVGEIISAKQMALADLIILALPPRTAISFFKENAKFIKSGTIVFDTCGVKQKVLNEISPIAKKHGIKFVGAHPMAGREFSGFDYSTETLFDNASFIVVSDETETDTVESICSLAKQIGFGEVKVTDAAHHDRVIAYTSQLAHIVSNSYCKSPTINEKDGFCAGSFADMTRVAKLDVKLWTELFMMNLDALGVEIENIIKNLQDFQKAVSDGDETGLAKLLDEGNEIKLKSLEKEKILKNPQ